MMKWLWVSRRHAMPAAVCAECRGQPPSGHRAAVTDSNMSLIQLNGVSRRYKTEGFEVALDNVSLSIDKGEFVAIMGQLGQESRP